MRIYNLSAETYKKFLDLLSILKNEFNDIFIYDDSFSSLNSKGDAIFKVKPVLDVEDFRVTIDSVKTNFPLLKLLQNENVKIYDDDAYKILTFKGESIEINLRYSTASENRVDTFEKNLKEITSISFPVHILEKIEAAAKSLKLENFLIKSDDGTLTIGMETPNGIKKIKFYSVKTDIYDKMEKNLSFPVNPLISFFNILKEFAEDLQEINFSILKDQKGEYYLQTDLREDSKSYGLILRRITSGNIAEVFEEEPEEEIEEEITQTQIQSSYSYSSYPDYSEEQSLKIF